MSRIDEALRRASLPGGRTLSEGAAPGGLEDSQLDRYPVESASPTPKAAVTAWPGGGTIPATRVRPKVRFDPRLAGKLVTCSQIRPVTLEQYRRLAATLLQAQADQSVRSLLVSSAAPREGKTLTACNLALTLSDSYGRNVLLIDGDLRRPSVHEVFGLSNGKGLSDALRRPGVEAPLVTVSPTLTVLPGGRADSSPMASLSSARMKTVIEEASSRFDWVILDSPPIGLLPDGQVLARLVDAVLFVVAAGTTPAALVQRAVSEVGADRIIGTVLNRADERASPIGSAYAEYGASTTAG